MDEQAYQDLKKVWVDVSMTIPQDKLREIFNNAINKAMEDDTWETITQATTTNNISVEPIRVDLEWTEDEVDCMLDVYYHLFDVGYTSKELYERIPNKMIQRLGDDYNTKTVQQYKDKLDDILCHYDYKKYLREIAEELESIPDDDATDMHEEDHTPHHTVLYYQNRLNDIMEDIPDDDFKQKVDEIVKMIEGIPEEYPEVQSEEENYCDYCGESIWDCEC